MPDSVATAGTWMMVLPEPPMAMQVLMALVMDSLVMICRAVIFLA